ELKDDFKARLLEVNPKLKDFTYGPESYDATVLAALAAEAAESDNGVALSKELQKVSADGTKCETYTDCLKLIKDGEDIDYDRVSGPVDLNDTRSPSKATPATFQ